MEEKESGRVEETLHSADILADRLVNKYRTKCLIPSFFNILNPNLSSSVNRSDQSTPEVVEEVEREKGVEEE